MSNPETDPTFERLIEHIRRSRGFDFTGYKRSSLTRRVRKRMQTVGLEEFGDYQDYLEVHPDEFVELFNTILINVTGFFRDLPAWQLLTKEVLPAVARTKANSDPVRVWSAGCASGEEPYTVAMLLAEELGLEAFKARVKIYATDVDEEALAHARHGTYTARDVEPIPEALRDRYLERSGEQHTFRKDIRRAVIFGRHDLVQDAPISRVDLIVCRNTLMYFNAEVQSHVYKHFHFALNPGGYLFLGKSEMLLTRTDIFHPVDLKRRIFTKRSSFADPELVSGGGSDGSGDDERDGADLFREALFENSPIAQVVVDSGRTLVGANAEARSQLGLASLDVGKPFSELGLSYQSPELRSRIEQVLNHGRPLVERSVPGPGADGDTAYYDVQVSPLEAGDRPGGVVISFTDVTQSSVLRQELERSQQELETAYEEIQSTVEELETTNEELQSTNEELETTNEELQSTNEELETMNEELQSTNEELETINSEFRQRTGQLNDANAYLEAVLSSLQAGVVVLDLDLAVRGWNTMAFELWGLTADEVMNKHLFNLDLGLPIEKLREPIRLCLSGVSADEVRVLDARNRRGRSFRCKVSCAPMQRGDGELGGIILLMEPHEPVNGE